jgi:hypothetical protein
VLALSKSSNKRQVSKKPVEDIPERPDSSRKTLLIIAGAVIICLIVAGLWLLTQHATVTPNSIVGTWTDNDNYHAYAYYSNGSMKEEGWLTEAGTTTHMPVFTYGAWESIGDNYYLVNPDITDNSTFKIVINGTMMNVINMSNSTTYKISDVPNVNLVKFNYPP